LNAWTDTIENLPNLVAVRLAAAWIQMVADEAEIRVLFFKGVAAVAHQLRPSPGKLGQDVDLLVDPAGFQRLIALLLDRGWLARPLPDEGLRIIRQHSVTLVHPAWPCDLDIHCYFPGLFAPADSAFEALWDDHDTLLVAGHHITAPSLPAHALILTVNALRSPASAETRAECARLADRYRTEPALWRAAVALSERLRAQSVIRPFAQEHGLPAPEPDLDAGEYRAWNLWVASSSRTMTALLYKATHRDLNWRSLRQILWWDGATLRQAHPEVREGLTGTVRGNLSRWNRGLRQLAGIGPLLRQLAPGPALRGDAPEFGLSVHSAAIRYADIQLRDGCVHVRPRDDARVSETGPAAENARRRSMTPRARQFADPVFPSSDPDRDVIAIGWAAEVEHDNALYLIGWSEGRPSPITITDPEQPSEPTIPSNETPSVLVLREASFAVWCGLRDTQPCTVAALVERLHRESSLDRDTVAMLVRQTMDALAGVESRGAI